MSDWSKVWDFIDRYVAPICIVGGLIALMVIVNKANAHHEPEHRQLSVGVWTQIPARLGVCDTGEQALSVAKAHQTKGEAAAKERWRRLNKTPGSGGAACGAIDGFFMVTEVIWQGGIEGRNVVVAEIAMIVPDYGPIPVPLYTILHGFHIVPRDVLGAEPA